MPRVADALSAMRSKTQQQDRAAVDPAGTLYRAGESGRINGE